MNLSIPLLLSVLFAFPAADKPGAAANVFSGAMYAPAAPAQSAYNRIAAVEFKAQEFCRAECDDFEYDASFKVVSATVYFSGASFPNVQTAFISSNSLKPIAGYMKRCVPGSIVVFDNVKVKGPDNMVRTIQPVRYELY